MAEADEQQTEEQPYLRITLVGAKAAIEVDLDSLKSVEVTEGGVFMVSGESGVTDLYSPSAWSLIETNLNL